MESDLPPTPGLPAAGGRARLFKIFYDEASRASIQAPFEPLDNRDGRADWFELWPMMTWLERNPLEDGVWYGFFSPKFPQKAGVSLDDVARVLAGAPQADVALFTYDWQIPVQSLNAWTQGERWQPGLIAATEAFLASRGEPVDLRAVSADLDDTVLSNFFVAKKRVWEDWLALARAYFDYVERGGPDLLDLRLVEHNSRHDYPLKVFVQERLICWLLHTRGYAVARPDYLAEPKFGSRALRLKAEWILQAKARRRRSGARGSGPLQRLLSRLPPRA